MCHQNKIPNFDLKIGLFHPHPIKMFVRVRLSLSSGSHLGVFSRTFFLTLRVYEKGDLSI